jgi:major membrane immunogen (membrane-anchored lipoprotein)
MWLPLAEYSLKNKVSISTLRRKIKTADIQYRLDDGKYFILDSAQQHRPSLETTGRETLSAETKIEKNSEPGAQTEHKSVLSAATESGESVITAANRLLTDLKKAYTQVLQDKEVQILNLKEDISDLKTLIKVLESENDRLRNQ